MYNKFESSCKYVFFCNFEGHSWPNNYLQNSQGVRNAKIHAKKYDLRRIFCGYMFPVLIKCKPNLISLQCCKIIIVSCTDMYILQRLNINSLYRSFVSIFYFLFLNAWIYILQMILNSFTTIGNNRTYKWCPYVCLKGIGFLSILTKISRFFLYLFSNGSYG